MMRPYKAALSFGIYRAGKWYDLDPDDPQVRGLVGAGYLISTVDVPSSGAEFFNGQGEAEPGAGEGDGGDVHVAAGEEDDEPDQ